MKNKKSELGQQSQYDSHYNPDKLYLIPRETKRKSIGIDPNALPFIGFDQWTHYEVSWLNTKGKPMVAIADIIYDCRSAMIVESKSLKLYFNSLNNTHFESITAVEATIKEDLSTRLKTTVSVHLRKLGEQLTEGIAMQFEGECIDHLEPDYFLYVVEPNFLKINHEWVEETLYSDLLKSNCLVTNQPDWGSIQISYQGYQIDRKGLLQYIVSYRNHNEFHEQCIERIFTDIMQHCKPKKLAVYGRYTRRGGLDINPYRSTHDSIFQTKHYRLERQ